MRFAVLFCVLSIFVACDSQPECDLCISSPKFAQLQIIGAYRGKKAVDGSWQRICGASSSDGIITDVAFLSSQRRSSLEGPDNDVSIRPGDEIDFRKVRDGGGKDDDIDLGSVDAMDVQIDCVNPAQTNGNDCIGTTVPRTVLDDVGYVARVSARNVGHDVILLMPLDQPFPNLAASVDRLIGILNPIDRVAIIGYSERGLVVPCSTTDRNFADDLARCFGAPDAEKWQGGVADAINDTGGRSNLWAAAEAAVGFLRDTIHDVKRSSHVIAFTTGPDTCAGETRDNCTTPCVTGDFRALADRLAADRDDATVPQVHLDFIQSESLFHPGIDARQVELACVSGGHHAFINANAIHSDVARQEVADVAAADMRYSLLGYWQLAATFPTSPDDGTVGAPPGSLYALQGNVTLRQVSHIVTSDKPFPFGFGQGQGAPDANNWDRRPIFVKPCGSFMDCGAGAAPDACIAVCSAETLTCAGGASGVSMPDLAQCDGGGGASGFCCAGACRTDGNCATCAQ